MKRIVFLALITACLFACKKEVKVSSVSLSQASLDIIEGETAQLQATVLPEDATDNSVTWASSKPSVATVSSSGLVTAIAEGQSIITASVGGKSATCSVSVNRKYIDVTSVELNKMGLELTEGDSETLIATVKPDNATDNTVTWNTSDATIASVENGKVTAMTQGEALITAKAGEKTASCKVVVKKKPTFFLNCIYGNIKPKMKNKIINALGDPVAIYIDGIKQETISDSYYFDEGTTHNVSFEYSYELQVLWKGMFKGCTALTSIEFPNSILTIADEAFYGCEALQSVELPAELQTIGDEAFRYCFSLKDIYIPDSTNSLGSYAFQYVRLDKLYLGKSVDYIGVGALETNYASSIEVSRENKRFDSRDNCNAIIETNSNTMLHGCPTSFIPGGIETIGSSCFAGCDLKVLEIPNSVSDIKVYAFSRCDHLVLDFGNTRTSIPTIGIEGNTDPDYYVVPDELYDYWLYAYKDKLWGSTIIKYSDYHQ